MSDVPKDQPSSPFPPPPRPAPSASPGAPSNPAPSAPPVARPGPSPVVPQPTWQATTPAPSAPVPPPPIALRGPAPLRPGQLPISWQIFMSLAGTAAFFAFAAVWKTSEEIGIGTWWLGTSSQPQPMYLRLLPFVVALLICLAAIYNVPRTALITAAGSVVCAVLAALDISRSGGLAAIEFAIAGSLLLVSIGAQVATVRRVTDA